MKTLSKTFELCLVLAFFLAMATVAKAQKMYWTDSGTDKIQRANLDGSDPEELITTGLSTPDGIALDAAASKMYWTDSGKIQRANLAGFGTEQLITGLSSPMGIALDVDGGKMYWTDQGTDKIQRANMDGSGVEDLVTTGLNRPQGIALDVTGGKMYWTDRGTDKIQRANLDGSETEDLVIGLNTPIGIALNLDLSKIYWTDEGTNKIQRANLDGSETEDIAIGLNTPIGLALDVAGGKMYWGENASNKIQRANLDGSETEDIITGVDIPISIALDIDGRLDTTFAGGNGHKGAMFDLTAINQIEITGFDFRVSSGTGTYYLIEVYYVTSRSSYAGNENNSGAWTFLGWQIVETEVAPNHIHVDIGGLIINPGETIGIYFTATDEYTGNIAYTDGTQQYSNVDLIFDSGVGKAFPFGATYSPRIWNGTIYYDALVDDCPSADLNGDCFVDNEDLAIVAKQWLTGTANIPDDMVYIRDGGFAMGDHFSEGGAD